MPRTGRSVLGLGGLLEVRWHECRAPVGMCWGLVDFWG